MVESPPALDGKNEARSQQPAEEKGLSPLESFGSRELPLLERGTIPKNPERSVDA